MLEHVFWISTTALYLNNLSDNIVMNQFIRITILTIIISSLTTFRLLGQNGFDQLMLSNGKLYTVVGVLVIIFIGLVLYLYNTDRKVRRLEDQINSNE